ncbi:MAG: ornithine carbamoyltransferase [Nitrospinae bacterium]|nr:ornithine carbamoyltransferase [Nitrospinota bacterium]
MNKDLLTIYNLTRDDIEEIFERADHLKMIREKGRVYQPLKGKILGMIFKKASTRTRISFEVGMYQLGGGAIYLNSSDLQWERGESIADTAKVLSQYLDGILIRTFAHEEVERLAEYADIPVINGLTDLLHPCQILSDIYTIKERLGEIKGVKIAYVGDGNNIANTWLIGAPKMGMDISIASPKGYQPNKEIVEKAILIARDNKSRVEIMKDPFRCVKDADIIYTDVWVSMGKEGEREERWEAFKSFQVNLDLIKRAKDSVLIMHCLPAHRGEEITSEVIDSERSIVFDQTRNRLHVQKGILEILLGGR